MKSVLMMTCVILCTVLLCSAQTPTVACSASGVFVPKCGPPDNPSICIPTGDAYNECSQICALLGCNCEFAYKQDGWPDGATGSHNADNGNVITISSANIDTTFDWSSVQPVNVVLVKASTGYIAYCYAPDGAYSGAGLVAPDGKNISHVTFCYNPLSGLCYEEETAWAEGSRYVKKGNWAMYVDYYGAEKTVELIADFTNYVHAGTVTFSAPLNGWVTITVNLTGGAIFYYDVNDPLYDDNLKVQDYAKAPTKTPSPGLFQWKTRIEPGLTTGTIVVPVNNFYGVHLDIALPAPCQ